MTLLRRTVTFGSVSMTIRMASTPLIYATLSLINKWRNPADTLIIRLPFMRAAVQKKVRGSHVTHCAICQRPAARLTHPPDPCQGLPSFLREYGCGRVLALSPVRTEAQEGARRMSRVTELVEVGQ